ncbi:sensor histidine kinase [Spirosoma utsteinense]|nr:histidine kinase [Spirosoma utsteinense]
MPLSSINPLLLRIHGLFWALFVLVGVMLNVAQHHHMQLSWALFWADLKDPLTAIGYGRTIGMSYVSLWVFDCLFRRRYYGLALVVLMGLIGGDVLLRYGIEQRLLGPYLGIWQYPASITLADYVGETVFFSALGIFLCFLLKSVNDYFAQEAIRHQKVHMELAYLKAQLNPHFLFNTMNNLYGLSLSEPQRAPDAILRLGEMMRYMLYESNEPLVPLSQEIDYLSGFIELETLRYSHRIYVDFTLEGDVNGKRLPPLLLIALVENCFKHGQLQEPDQPVRIWLAVSGSVLRFETSNGVATHLRDPTGGVGLPNVKRRLVLLYPRQHQLQAWQEGATYHALLEIHLTTLSTPDAYA